MRAFLLLVPLQMLAFKGAAAVLWACLAQRKKGSRLMRGKTALGIRFEGSVEACTVRFASRSAHQCVANMVATALTPCRLRESAMCPDSDKDKFEDISL